jgi:hypothetical protein
MDPRKGEILNVDLDLKLRIMGQAHHSLHIDTDEGDGYTFIRTHIGLPELEPKPHHYEEWVGQLEYIVDWMKDKIGPQNVRTEVRRKNRFQILKGKDSC